MNQEKTSKHYQFKGSLLHIVCLCRDGRIRAYRDITKYGECSMVTCTKLDRSDGRNYFGSTKDLYSESY